MSVATYTKSGAKATTPVKLEKTIFAIDVQDHSLLKQAYVGYLANGRTNDAVVKTRGLVSGGGKKPWKQKGTGRARFGSSRNPIWRGGGIVFGPTGQENYTHKMQTTAKRAAIRQALSLAVAAGKVRIIETFECKDGRVQPTLQLMEKIGASGSVLLVVSVKDALAERATRNAKNIQLVQAMYLNVYDILNADSIVISKKAIDMIHDWLAVEKTAAKKGGK